MVDNKYTRYSTSPKRYTAHGWILLPTPRTPARIDFTPIIQIVIIAALAYLAVYIGLI